MLPPSGVHPRLIPQAPDFRPSLAMLPPLHELGDDFAWAVWHCVRRACTSAAPVPLSPEDEAAMAARVDAAAERVPELRDEMEALRAFACGGPGTAAVADALARLSDWLAERGMLQPALHCAEAAAALVPDSSEQALVAGRVNRLFGDTLSRADLYYERAIPLARRVKNWRNYVRAHLGKGYVKKALGDSAAAHAHFNTAARAARSLSGEKWLASQTHHDLLAITAEEGDFRAALRHAQRALECYPLHDQRLPALLHDFAFLLLRMRCYAPSVELADAVMSRTPLPPQDQVVGWSTVAHAAAGTGDADRFRAAADRVLRLVALYDVHGAAAFSNLACGAQLLGWRDEAERYALRSLQIAEQRQQAEAIPQARQVLATLDGPHPDYVVPPLPPRLLEQAARMLPAFTARLAEWRGPTWKPNRAVRRASPGDA